MPVDALRPGCPFVEVVDEPSAAAAASVAAEPAAEPVLPLAETTQEMQQEAVLVLHDRLASVERIDRMRVLVNTYYFSPITLPKAFRRSSIEDAIAPAWFVLFTICPDPDFNEPPSNLAKVSAPVLRASCCFE